MKRSANLKRAWRQVYEGLSDEEIASILAMIMTLTYEDKEDDDEDEYDEDEDNEDEDNENEHNEDEDNEDEDNDNEDEDEDEPTRKKSTSGP